MKVKPRELRNGQLTTCFGKEARPMTYHDSSQALDARCNLVAVHDVSVDRFLNVLDGALKKFASRAEELVEEVAMQIGDLGERADAIGGHGAGMVMLFPSRARSLYGHTGCASLPSRQRAPQEPVAGKPRDARPSATHRVYTGFPRAIALSAHGRLRRKSFPNCRSRSKKCGVKHLHYAPRYRSTTVLRPPVPLPPASHAAVPRLRNPSP